MHVDTPFTFALVLAAGAGAAAVVMAASCALYDLAHRKPLYKLTFNIGTHTIGLAAGTAVWMALAGGQGTGSSALPAILTGTAVFVAVKAALFVGSVALDEELRQVVSPARILRQSVLVVVMAQVGVLVLVLAAERPALLLLALGPMLGAFLLLRSETRAVLDRQDAEETARREAELRAQEQEVARKLKETDQMKDDLLAMVSHELRTPLTTVVGALRLLSDGPALSPDERQEMLEMADRQARRLRVLIEQLLLAAQSDNGRAAFLSSATERVDADAADLLLAATTEAQAGGCGDRVRLRCDRSLPVRLAPDPVLQILGNLVDNACKYGPRAARVAAGRARRDRRGPGRRGRGRRGPARGARAGLRALHPPRARPRPRSRPLHRPAARPGPGRRPGRHRRPRRRRGPLRARLPLREPATRLLPSAAEDRAAPCGSSPARPARRVGSAGVEPGRGRAPAHAPGGGAERGSLRPRSRKPASSTTRTSPPRSMARHGPTNWQVPQCSGAGLGCSDSPGSTISRASAASLTPMAWSSAGLFGPGPPELPVALAGHGLGVGRAGPGGAAAA